ncbi:MAG: TetR/AcrR family transcriptional regulator [Syntrophobacteraceae bacterium]
MEFEAFKNEYLLSMETICEEIFKRNTDSIKVKKQKFAVRNLTKIIDTALRLSNRMGFHAMGLRALSKESGLSMGGLYAYFDGKDELLRIIQDYGRQVLMELLLKHTAQESDPQRKLETAIKVHLYLSEIMRDWFFFSYMEARFLSKNDRRAAIEGELKTEQMFSRIMEEGCREGVFTVADTVLAASVIKAMLQDWYLKRWKYAGRNVSVEDYAEHVIGWTRAYLGCGFSRQKSGGETVKQ